MRHRKTAASGWLYTNRKLIAGIVAAVMAVAVAYPGHNTEMALQFLIFVVCCQSITADRNQATTPTPKRDRGRVQRHRGVTLPGRRA